MWGAILVVLTVVGFATVVGLELVMPCLAYATERARRVTLDASDWPLQAGAAG
ncbi:MAG: hypothetical protein KGN77_09525 [Xanthomonadaceae bacterium]|nr:hypothetical protein [Xanthomonadaceae bacterium]MDE1965309.1 hypothetical protein [Xanthomonadaceae bacterium]